MFRLTRSVRFIKYISQANTGIVTTFGKISRVVSPGLCLYMPIVQSVALVSNRVHQIPVKLNVKTKDNVTVDIALIVHHMIEPANAVTAFTKLANPNKQISSYVENIIRSSVSKIRLDALYESHDDMAQSVKEKMYDLMHDYGYDIKDCLVTSIELPRDIETAMNRINSAERLKEAAIAEAEAEYIKNIKQAEAERDKKHMIGQGIALQRKAILEGYKEGISELQEKLGLSNADVSRFVSSLQYMETMESIGKSQNCKTVFMDKAINVNYLETESPK